MSPLFCTAGTCLGNTMKQAEFLTVTRKNGLLQLLEQNEWRKAMDKETPPKEREQHFEQAHKYRDMQFAHNLIRGLALGR